MRGRERKKRKRGRKRGVGGGGGWSREMDSPALWMDLDLRINLSASIVIYSHKSLSIYIRKGKLKVWRIGRNSVSADCGGRWTGGPVVASSVQSSHMSLSCHRLSTGTMFDGPCTRPIEELGGRMDKRAGCFKSKPHCILGCQASGRVGAHWRQPQHGPYHDTGSLCPWLCSASATAIRALLAFALICNELLCCFNKVACLTEKNLCSCHDDNKSQHVQVVFSQDYFRH